jgi:hypothetical protein
LLAAHSAKQGSFLLTPFKAGRLRKQLRELKCLSVVCNLGLQGVWQMCRGPTHLDLGRGLETLAIRQQVSEQAGTALALFANV